METNVIDKEEPIDLVKEQANLGGIRISAAVSMHRDLARSDQLIDYLSTSPRVRLHRGAEGMSNTNTVEASGDRRCRETRDAASHSCEEGRGRERCCSVVITVLRASGIVNGGRVGGDYAIWFSYTNESGFKFARLRIPDIMPRHQSVMGVRTTS